MDDQHPLFSSGASDFQQTNQSVNIGFNQLSSEWQISKGQNSSLTTAAFQKSRHHVNPGDAGGYESFLSNGNNPVQYRNKNTGDISGDDDQVKILD